MASQFFLQLDFLEVKNAILAVADVMDPKSYEFRQIVSKAVGEGGKVLAEGLRGLIPESSIRRGRGSDPSQGSTGLLRRSITAVVRQGRDKISWYVLVGANAATAKTIRRGRGQINRQPAKYVHLIDGGFRAFARQPGLAGLGARGERHDWRGLRQFETGLRVSQSIEKGADTKSLNRYEKRALQFLLAMQNDQTKVSQFRRLQSIRAGQKFTMVPGKNYFAVAAGRFETAAVQAVLDGLAEWTTKIFERRLDRYAKRAGLNKG